MRKYRVKNILFQNVKRDMFHYLEQRMKTNQLKRFLKFPMKCCQTNVLLELIRMVQLVIVLNVLEHLPLIHMLNYFVQKIGNISDNILSLISQQLNKIFSFSNSMTGKKFEEITVSILD